MQASGDYQLIDFGGGARLERFGARTVDRPHPAALGARADVAAWSAADLRFDRDRGWTGPAASDGSWPIEVDGLSFELRPTDAGQLGLFPEQLAMVPWLRDRIAARGNEQAARDAPMPPTVLHLFAYTGLATLALADAGAAVTHVDSARPTVAWARRNADLSALGDRPIRWIVDDALAFAEREVRRKRRYDGLVLDPPSYGHGPAGQPWRLAEQLDTLLETSVALLRRDAFVVLTAHTPGFDGDRLAALLSRALTRPASGIDRAELVVECADGRRLELGAFARWPGGAS
jgi:23S rRNA (cytosine1962-C5)-methyltransferase